MLSDKPFEVPPYLLDRIEGMDRVRMAIAGAGMVSRRARTSLNMGLLW